MTNIEDLIKKNSIDMPTSQISKHISLPSDEKKGTEANAVVLGSMNQIGVQRIKAQSIPKWLLAHPATERGIEFKFNRMISQLDAVDIANNILPADDTGLAKEAKEYCVEILKNSHTQPVSFIKQYGRDAMRFGDNYVVLIPNKANSKIMRWELQHPVFFSPMFDFVNRASQNRAIATTQLNASMLVDRTNHNVKYRIISKTKKPKEYTQLKKLSTTMGLEVGINTKDPTTMSFVPTGKVIHRDKVVQLNFDRMGDEPYGIPMAQTLWIIVNQILRVEDAGAETMVAFGYNRWIAHTQFRSPEKMRDFGKSIENIAKRSIVILPEGVKIDTVKPGSTEFDKVHNILLSLIAMRLGISIIQLKGEGADINKATLGSIMKDVRHDFFADELEVEAAINEGFVKSCKVKYNLRTSIQMNKFPFPRFRFNEMAEDEDIKAARFLKLTLGVRNLAVAIDALNANGFVIQSQTLLDHFMKEFVIKEETVKDFTEKDKKVTPKKIIPGVEKKLRIEVKDKKKGDGDGSK